MVIFLTERTHAPNLDVIANRRVGGPRCPDEKSLNRYPFILKGYGVVEVLCARVLSTVVVHVSPRYNKTEV